jgi:hypothetical protein
MTISLSDAIKSMGNTYNSSSVKPNFSNSVNVAIMKSRLEKSIAEDSDSDETDKIAVSSQDEKTYDSFNEGR